MRSALCLTLATCCVMGAAEGGGTIQPAPGFEPGNPAAPVVSGQRQNRPPMQFPRPLPAYEVEILAVKAGDQASVTAWTLLAAQGYHVTAATPTDGGTVLYLERAASPGGQGQIQLPAMLEQDRTTADSVRAKIKAVHEERQKALSAPPPGASGK